MNISKNGKIAIIFGAIGFTELFILVIGVTMFQNLIIDYLSVFETIFSIFLISAWIFDVLGLYFGIKSLEQGEKRLARTGIILSALGLLEYLILYFILASTFGMI